MRDMSSENTVGRTYVLQPSISEKQSNVEKPSVSHPSHYNKGQIEVIDFIEDQHLGFCLGNAIKYISRHDSKGVPAADLKKAIWYILRELKIVHGVSLSVDYQGNKILIKDLVEKNG